MSSCHGRELKSNREDAMPNFNLSFSFTGLGASKDPCAVDYRGPAAMSEKEVKFLNGFLNSEAKRLVGYLDVHSYSQFWMIPWGSDMRNVADYDELVSLMRRLHSMPFSMRLLRDRFAINNRDLKQRRRRLQ